MHNVPHLWMVWSWASILLLFLWAGDIRYAFSSRYGNEGEMIWWCGAGMRRDKNGMGREC